MRVNTFGAYLYGYGVAHDFEYCSKTIYTKVGIAHRYTRFSLRQFGDTVE